MRLLKLILLALGMISLLISLLPLGFASLAFLGVLADVGPAENREMGVQLLSWGLPPSSAVSCYVLSVSWHTPQITVIHTQRRAQLPIIEARKIYKTQYSLGTRCD